MKVLSATKSASRSLKLCEITAQSCRAYSLIEVLVYISVLAVLMTLGYAAVFRCVDNSVGLRRNADDIARAIHAGEIWRADVRAADRPPQIETNASGMVLQLSQTEKRVAYRFAGNTVARRIGDSGWTPLLTNVKSCEFLPNLNCTNACRWELELLPRRKTLSTIRPLFTFLAVPTTKSTP